jgi:hypothetical protein
LSGSRFVAVLSAWFFVLGGASRLAVAETSAVGLMNVDFRLLIFDLEERSWSLMRRAFFHRGDAGVEVVEAFDGLV